MKEPKLDMHVHTTTRGACCQRVCLVGAAALQLENNPWGRAVSPAGLVVMVNAQTLHSAAIPWASARPTTSVTTALP